MSFLKHCFWIVLAAISLLPKLCGFGPKTAVDYLNRGRAYYHKGQYDKAIADLSDAIRLDPQLSDPFYWRGKSYNEKGQFQNAIPDFTEAIQLDPEHDDYTDRAFAYIGLGEYDKAIVDC